MNPLTLPLSQARQIALSAGTGFHRPESRGPAAVAEVVGRIGFVQIDTISVVERAHHHILAARVPGYQTAWLDKAPVFEYWGHAASYLPWQDFRYTLARKERILANGHDWMAADWGEVAKVLDRIRSEGPLMARDFEAPKRSAGWWDWKPAKRALEYLFMSGQLMVTRKGFQKVFDLTERVLPAGTDTSTPTPREQADWYVRRALDAFGLVARDEIAYLRREHTDDIKAVLAEGETSGQLTRVVLEHLPKVPHWVRTADLDRVSEADRSLRILSPFDPVLIHRKRLNRLFGFDFTIECYVPEPKRTFGYFALPLFWNGTFTGLLDAKADRAAGRLLVQNLRYDGPARKRASFEAAFDKAVAKFAAFNGVEAPESRSFSLRN